MNRRIIGMAALTLAVSLSSQTSQALWGKATTKTEDSNAKMGLPEYKGLKHAIGCKKFENQAGWAGSWDLGDNLSIMLQVGVV